ncbi:MAG: TspO/MBR family protein [Caldilineaceae bacterium]
MIKQTHRPAIGAQLARIQWPALAVALVVPFIAAAIGNRATNSSLSGWYRRLRKPTWNPPAWVFGPVWTTLYLLMGVASWLVWRQGQLSAEEETIHDRKAAREEVRGALTVYGIQLGLNALWSVLFFGARRVDLALMEVATLWSTMLVTLNRFYRIHPLAGLLLVPYQLWVTFATLLNARVWQLNRNQLRNTVSEWLHRLGV